MKMLEFLLLLFCVSVILYALVVTARAIRALTRSSDALPPDRTVWRRACNSCRYRGSACEDMSAGCGCALWESKDGC